MKNIKTKYEINPKFVKKAIPIIIIIFAVVCVFVVVSCSVSEPENRGKNGTGAGDLATAPGTTGDNDNASSDVDTDTTDVTQDDILNAKSFTIIIGDISNLAHGGADEEAIRLNSPTGLMVEDNRIYIADTHSNRILISINGELEAFAGLVLGYDVYDRAVGALHNATLLDSLFLRPSGIMWYETGMLILDSGNNVIRHISIAGNVTTFVGTGRAGSNDGTRLTARFNNPQGFCKDDDGNIYIADTGNHTIRMISPGGAVTTIAGTAGERGFRDGNNALFDSPVGIVWKDGVLNITDTDNHRVRTLKDGVVSTLAGPVDGYLDVEGNYAGGYLDGDAGTALFNNPTGIAIGADSTVYIADTGNSVVRYIKDGAVGTLAGFGGVNDPGNSNLERMISPRGLFISNGELYITDMFKNTVLRIG